MILLELTEDEAETVLKEMSFSKNAILKNGIGHAEKERLAKTRESIIGKLEIASKPKEDLLITHKNLLEIISLAKSQYQELRGDLCISKETVLPAHRLHISLANALVLWFNSKNMLKRLARFDYTDNSYQYESEEE